MNVASYPINQTFSFSRWANLVLKHWMENKKRYLLTLIAMAGLLTAWYSFVLVMDKLDPLDIFFQFSAYYVGLYFTGCLYASTLFSELSGKKEGIGYLALPASQLEKLLCVLFYGVFLFFIAFTLMFYLVNIPIVQLSNRLLEQYPRFWPNSTQRVAAFPIYNVFSAADGPLPEKNYHLFLAGFFAIQSAFILGSVYFTRYAFIKTTVALVLYILFFVAFLAGVISHMLPRGWEAEMLRWHKAEFPGPFRAVIRLPSLLEICLVRGSQCCFPFIFWIITYFRLREKEV
jgi:hypothetical protein